MKSILSILQLAADLKHATSEDGEPVESSKKWTLADIYENDEYQDKAIDYWYGEGGDWLHSIELIGCARTKTTKVVCIAGEGCGPAENCGGAGAWARLKEYFEKHGSHPHEGCSFHAAHDDIYWYKEICPNGHKEGLDKWKWNKEDINKEFGKTKGGLMAKMAKITIS